MEVKQAMVAGKIKKTEARSPMPGQAAEGVDALSS